MSESVALVVEDDPSERGVLRLLLESAGWFVMAAHDGASGLDIARRIPPDVVVMDLRMPNMTGMELATAFAGSAKLGDVPCIAVTSDRSGMRTTAKNSGLFKAVLTKPVAPEALLAVVRDAVDH